MRIKNFIYAIFCFGIAFVLAFMLIPTGAFGATEEGGVLTGSEAGGSTNPSDRPTEYVKTLLLKMDEADTKADPLNKYGDSKYSDGNKHFVGESYDKNYTELKITKKGKTVKLNGYYTTNLSDGRMYETANSSNNMGEIVLEWNSSNTDVATVSPDGIITPRKNGTVTISAKVKNPEKYQGDQPGKSLKFIIDGQEGEYVSAVTIIDGAGNDLGKKNGETKTFTKANEFFSFYALVKWVDSDGRTVRTEDTRTDKVTSTIQWEMGGSKAPATINKDTGRLKTTEYSGNAYVLCTVTGGLGGKSIKDRAQIQVDTGKYEYNPADSLTLKVVYEEYPDKVAQKHTYSFSNLQKKLTSRTYNYTVLGESRYGAMRAQGFLFKDVVLLEGVNLNDVYQFRFGTADGYDNPVTYKYLYQNNRYYFPNYEIGGSKAEAQISPPLLAYNSNFTWGQSEVDPTAKLDANTRFRLAFGPLWSCETNSKFQIYYINSITIVLKGAPKAHPKDGSGKDSKAGKGNGGKGGIAGSGIGSGNGGSGDIGSGSAGSPGGDSGAGLDGADGVSVNPESDEAGSRGWRAYEMMNKSSSIVDPLDFGNNPLSPLTVPLGVASLIAGAMFTIGGYRRRLKYD